MDRASDLCQFRINAVLKEMSEAQLCELPEDEPWTTEQFLKRTQVGEKTGSSVVFEDFYDEQGWSQDFQIEGAQKIVCT